MPTQSKSKTTPPVEAVKTVLVVDNERPVLDYISLQLRKAHYTTLSATNRAETLKVLKQQPDGNTLIVVLDVALDDENGIELAKELVSLYPKIKILLISGYADDVVLTGDVPEGSRTAFLRKIFSATELLEAIKRLDALA